MIMLCSCGKSAEKPEKENTLQVQEVLREQTIEQLQVNESDDTMNQSDYKTLNHENQKAIWLTMMDYEDILKGKTESEFTESIKSAFENMKKTGINTVYAHVRPYNDAYYKSEIFPRSEYYSADMKYDPLEIMVAEAHKSNLSIHAWINPLRCQTDEQIKGLDGKYTVKQWYDSTEKKGTYISEIDGRWYLNPAYDEVRNYIADGVKEIIENYNVDGIHIDDYFYPTQDETFDTAAFKESGKSDLEQWRTENINLMVKKIYNTINEYNPDILFGISPQGNITSNYDTQYADVKKWASETGYCDYIVPQIYFGFKNESMPFEETVNKWSEIKTCDDVKLIIGICTYKVGNEDKWAGSGKNEWKENVGIPAKQADYVIKNKKDGIAVYSYGSTFADDKKEECEKLAEVLSDTDG
jgi:uncharacterized lipoprotein YddW (UPF0748 family)